AVRSDFDRVDATPCVTEAGPGLRSYAVAGRPILDGYDADEMCPSGRGQVLIPWPNRIADGRYAFAGEEQQLAIDERGTGSALHGLVRWARGSPARRARARGGL